MHKEGLDSKYNTIGSLDTVVCEFERYDYHGKTLRMKYNSIKSAEKCLSSFFCLSKSLSVRMNLFGIKLTLNVFLCHRRNQNTRWTSL